MSKSFKFIDHTADIAVELAGSSLNELFKAGAEAWLTSAIEKIDLKFDDLIKYEYSANSKEELLVSFLNELNFLLTVKKWLCLTVDSIEIIENPDELRLAANLNGTKLNSNIELKQEIKSVTYHQMEIIKKKNFYSTLVVFDI